MNSLRAIPMNEPMHWRVESEAAGTRLDSCLSRLTGLSRAHVQKLIANGCASRNRRVCKPSDKVQEGDLIALTIPQVQELAVEPQNIPLDIRYEDGDVIVVNKPRGMVVHPAPGTPDHTLVNALLYHCRDLSGIGGVLRPGIVHRIDKDTTGLLIVAKNDAAHQALADQIANRTCGRIYWALVEGNVKEYEGQIVTRIGRHPTDRKKMAVLREQEGREAVTHYRVLRRYARETLVECRLETGRTHQIRVHMAHIGHPVIGDATYGYKKQRYALEGQLLHAKELHFIHPATGESVSVQAPLPDDFALLLLKLEAQLPKNTAENDEK